MPTLLAPVSLCESCLHPLSEHIMFIGCKHSQVFRSGDVPVECVCDEFVGQP